MTYTIKEQHDGNFIVMVEKELPIKRPFWKFWGATSKKQWVTAYKKDGTRCIYDKKHKAEAFVRLKGGKLIK